MQKHCVSLTNVTFKALFIVTCVDSLKKRKERVYEQVPPETLTRIMQSQKVSE